MTDSVTFGEIDTSKFEAQLNSIADLNVIMPTKEGAQVILDKSQELVPVRTGNLKNSGEVIEQSEGYAVQYTTNYAAPVEFGTSKMAAQPYLRPAIDESQDKVLEAAGKNVEEQIGSKI